LFAVADNGGSVPGANDLLRSLYDVATAAAAKSDTARTNLAKYLHACEKRRDVRHHV